MNPELKRKRRHLVAMAAVVTVTLVLLYLLGSVLLALGLSVAAAYVLLPVARLLERAMPWRRDRPGLSRGIAVTVIFIAVLGILAGLLALVIPPTVEQGQRFAEGFPEIFQSARGIVEGWVGRYTEQIPPEIRSKIEETAAGAGGTVTDAAWSVVAQTLRVVSGSFAFILGLATAPMMVFYLMKDSTAIRTSLSAPFPQGLRPYLQDALDIADRTIGAYIRGQLTLGIIVGTVVTIGLLLLGVPFAFVLGIVAGLTELVPIIGPWIGGAAGVLVTLATEPDKLPWVIMLYLAVQLLENVFLVLSQLRFSIYLRKRTIRLSCFVGSVVGGGGSDGQGQVRCAAGGGTTGRTPASDSGWETPGPSHRQGPGSPQERRRLAGSPSG